LDQQQTRKKTRIPDYDLKRKSFLALNDFRGEIIFRNRHCCKKLRFNLKIVCREYFQPMLAHSNKPEKPKLITHIWVMSKSKPLG
jgi:hypothetical protein